MGRHEVRPPSLRAEAAALRLLIACLHLRGDVPARRRGLTLRKERPWKSRTLTRDGASPGDVSSAHWGPEPWRSAPTGLWDWSQRTPPHRRSPPTGSAGCSSCHHSQTRPIRHSATSSWLSGPGTGRRTRRITWRSVRSLLIADPSFNGDTPPTPPNPNNFTHTAGVTFMGQFMDHDMTFDVTSQLGVVRQPTSSLNARTPRFDLDSVYGGGPTVNPMLYRSDGLRFRVDTAPGGFEDLPRASDGSALIADPRNDEHMMIPGLHAAVLLFHIRAVDVAVSDGITDPTEIFEWARQLTTWHYQWMVLHEFLPLFVGQDRVDRAMVRRHHYRPSGSAFIPVEFQGAVYRFGHSMVRPSYRANLAGDAGGPFFGMSFDPAFNGVPDPDDLRGGQRSARRFIGWQTFFRFPGFEGDVRPNKKIDTNLSTPLFDLTPGTIAGPEQAPNVLPQRTLLRHITWLLPSGQAIARELGVPVMSRSDLSELRDIDPRFDRSTPLFYYNLKEAELMKDGERLGDVGGRSWPRSSSGSSSSIRARSCPRPAGLRSCPRSAVRSLETFTWWTSWRSPASTPRAEGSDFFVSSRGTTMDGQPPSGEDA
jgi:hypothetical protein